MWEEIYQKHYPELLRYAAGVCKNQTEAEDAAQEVFLKALQNADTFEDLGPSQKRAWTAGKRLSGGPEDGGVLPGAGDSGDGKPAAAGGSESGGPGAVPPAL